MMHKKTWKEAAARAAPRWGIEEFGTDVSFDTLDFSKSGATGDPRRATKRAGERLYRAALERLVGLVHWLEELPDEGLRPKDHKP